jgi:putative ABC transport system permease protein
MRELWSKLRRALGGRRGLSDDLAEEIESNLDLAAEDHRARGLEAGQARDAARRSFGNATLIRENAREAWTFPRFETFLQDLRFGLRNMRKSPGFALIVILTLALGIGANTAIFSVVDTVLLKPLPYPDAERLVQLGESAAKAEGISVTWGNYLVWRNYNHSFEDMAGFQYDHMTLTGRDEPLFTTTGEITGGFFHLVGAKPFIGRLFTDEEDRAGGTLAVVLDYDFWMSKLGGDPKILNTTLALNDRAFHVVGVLAPGLRFFSRGVDYYLPLGRFRRDSMPRGQHGSMRILARLRPGVTLTAARADLDQILQRMAQQDQTENDHRAYARFLADLKTQDIRSTLWMLMGAVGLILLIACSNVANLVLARSAARSREIAIRTAIGAGRGRLIQQVLTENLLIAALGGVLGLLLASWSLRVLLLMAPAAIPRLQETTLDSRVLIFTAALALFTGLLVGFAPIFTAGKIELTKALNAGGRSGTGTKRERSFRNVLVVAEITITVVLAFSSGLLLRSLIAAQNLNPGYIAEHVLSLELALPSSSYKDPQSIQNFYGGLMGSVRALPGVASVAAVNCPPSAGDCGDWWYSILGQPVPAKSEVPLSLFNVANPEYFQTMGIPVKEGRVFTAADRQGAPPVAVVNEVIARRWFPKESAVGHTIKVGGPYAEGNVLEIVGVVGNVSQDGLDGTPMAEIYQPFAQRPSEGMVVMIRAAGDPNALAPAVRRIVSSMDHNLPIQSLRSFEKRVAATLDRRRFTTLLLTIFAGLALILSAVGVYGLLNYWVTAREEEIAIRQALGASRATILRWAGFQASQLILAGIVLGVLAGWSASHWLDSLVFGISARDATMMSAATLVVIAIAALASAWPLFRATRVDAASKLQRA